MKDMKKFTKKFLAFLMAAMTVFTVSCGSSASEENAAEDGGSAVVTENSPEEESPKEGTEGSDTEISDSFAAVHDAFTTTLTSEENDSVPIPDPPEGYFDLVSYPSKVGDLAAYVSSDPGDGEKHPMIIWVVGGWGNDIDDFPFMYPEWDNDQTGSAFWQAGILTMYPSFRGGNGNPGYYETLFGEVDDIVSAYEYAASLPYVDPERIYLGGHSTGGTRALLASEYTDKFRAVFCFGAVDEIKYHNNDQFTFDTSSEEEQIMRSPIYWLDDIVSPTFLIEGRAGNSENLERMEAISENASLHCYVVEGADHFSVLAPATRVVARKILEDTGGECAISITKEELDTAMEQGMTEMPVPVMTERYVEELGMTFSCPYLWDVMESEDGSGLDAYSRYDGENAWDMAALYITPYVIGEGGLQSLKEEMENQGETVDETTIGGNPALDGTSMLQNDGGSPYYHRYVLVQHGEDCVNFNFIVSMDYIVEADLVFQQIIDSIAFDD